MQIQLLKTWLIIIGMIAASGLQAQGKYFEARLEKNEFSGSYYGIVAPINKQPDIRLEAPGKNKQQLLDKVLQYLKERPALKIDTVIRGSGPVVVYRDFATIGTKEKCFADLVALTYVFVVPEEGYVSVRLGAISKIFASIFDAKLQISPDGVVVSDNDAPFNEYKFIQPADGRTQSKVSPNGGLVGLATSRKVPYKLAYPDSIFDPGGKIVNANNKKLIETFFDGYVSDLQSFLQKK